jgi:hypothetical protein
MKVHFILGDRVSTLENPARIGVVVSVSDGALKTYVRVRWPGEFKGGRRLPGTFSNTYAERLVLQNETEDQ